MTDLQRIAWGAVLAGGFAGQAVLGQADGSAPAQPGVLALNTSSDLVAPAPAWRVQAEPVMWFASPAGRLRMPGATRGDRIRLSSLNLDSPQASVAGELHLRSDRWRFFLSGAENSLDRRTIADDTFALGDVDVSPGDPLNVSFEWVSVEALAGYKLWDRDFRAASVRADRAIPVSIRVDGLAGLRADDIGFGVREAGGGASQVDEIFVTPVIGARAEVELLDDFTIDLQVTGGVYADSDTSSTALDVVLAFHWRPHPNVATQIGWRQSLVGFTSGSGAREFDYGGTVAGVQAGIVIRF